ncbi:MAG TPA: alpha-amylase family glycosyl hydrolase, partial [Spirochaetota bacterium]|nr:alpha-amylase family glycosyl hydrolase [Spirochaetota bacterium]
MSCNKSRQPVQWAGDAVLYEVNIRQYTKDGTFRAFMPHLDRLAQMGIDILWFMPVHPISKKKRKGKLGSYYAVRDYLKINPEFGTAADFRQLIKKAHSLGMYVLMDWVPNHCGWDNKLLRDHPEWFTRNKQNKIIHPPDTDWTDVADFNYSNRELWAYMQKAMAFWVKEYDIDGYRVDVAGSVPENFWEQTIKALRKIKPLFMLAEDGSPRLLKYGFDMYYGWEQHHLMNSIAAGKKNAADMAAYFKKIQRLVPRSKFIMHFTSNHDENSWHG